MTQPKVTITELDGSLGVLPPSAGSLFALVGVSSSGTNNAPATYARIDDITAAFGAGPLVEAAAHYIQNYGRPVVLVKTAQSVAGAVGAVTSVETGTAVVTVTAAPTPLDDYELKLLIVAGGTRGVAGITYQTSVDGGRTYGAVTALGTATSLTFPGAGVGFDIAAGTLVAGDTFTARAVAPNWNSSDLSAALTALGNSAVLWELVHVVGPLDATSFDTIESFVSGLVASGKYRGWIASTRMPLVAESEATYLTSLSGVFGAKTTKFGTVCAGATKTTSSVSGRKYKRPFGFAYAARQASTSEQIDIADVNLGALPGVSIRDANGNADEHDESINPGLDDARFAVARTWDGFPGVYPNRPRLFSTAGSDFQLMPHRRVLNLAHAALRAYFVKRLNAPILVNAATGFILETEALEIEAGALASMRAVLMATPKASGIQFTLSRTDNLLSTSTLNGQARVIPLAYPEFINLSVGFFNPALAVQAV
jgi:hypothetical protein